VAGTARLMDEYGLDGVYLDGTGCPLPCYNHYHGCGPRDGVGRAHPRYTFWATRSLMRRLWQVVSSRNPNGQINLHNSAFMTVPTIAFATSLWDGEQLSTTPGRTLPERMPLDYFRTEFMGHQWGLAAEFLEYVLPYSYRQEWGLTLLHDVPTRPYGPHDQLELASQLWNLMERFGRRQATWLPYWRNGDVVTVQPSAAYVSLYRHPRNGVLAVVYNYGARATEVTVALQRAKLGLAERVVATDALTGMALDCEGGTLHLPLDSLGWQLVWLRQEQ